MKLSLEQVALLEGRIVEAKADALPDITWNTLAMRSRDPGLLNSPNFDEFPPEFRDALRADCRRNAFSTSADVRQTLFSFKLGKALEAARVARSAGEQDVQRARQVTALDAIRAYNQLLFAIEQLRVIQHERAVEADATSTTRATGARRAWRPSSKCFAPRSISRTRAPRRCAPRTKCRARARLLNTVMLRPTSDAD